MNEKNKNITIVLLFMTIFIGLFFVNVFTKDNEISESERRRLTQFPELSWARILNSDFMDEFEEYVLDQFIFRDGFRRIKSRVEFNVFHKRDNNGLFVRGGHIFSQVYPLNEWSVRHITSRMNHVYDLYLQNMNVYYTIIPDKNYFLPDNRFLKMDYNHLINMMNTNLNRMEYIDIFNNLMLMDYYRTDLHWKQENLDLVLNTLANRIGFTLSTDYKTNYIHNFRGALYGQLALPIELDTIVYLTNDITNQATVHNRATDEITKVYDLTRANGVDMYDIFLSGPVAFIDIHNPLANTDKELVIFRDSFGSSIAPLMMRDYRKITLIDIRYISINHIGNLIQFNNQDVLFMYGTEIINNSRTIR